MVWLTMHACRLTTMVRMCALVLAFAGLAAAQNADTASVRGTVRDAQNAVMGNVTVTARNVDTGLVRTDVTATAGTYRLPALAPGSYELTATLTGFRTSVRNGIVLLVGAEAVIDFNLQVADVQTQVVVSGDAPVVDTVSPTTGANLDRNQLEMAYPSTAPAPVPTTGRWTDWTIPTTPRAHSGCRLRSTLLPSFRF